MEPSLCATDRAFIEPEVIPFWCVRGASGSKLFSNRFFFEDCCVMFTLFFGCVLRILRK